MISTAHHHHHYSPMFSPIPSDMRPYSSGLSSQRIQTSGLESLSSGGSQYALQHMQSLSMPSTHGIGPTIKSSAKVRHHPYENAHSKSRDQKQRSARNDDRNTSGPVRRRISRACDQCNQLRTKCDGMSPCAHCIGKCQREMLVPFSIISNHLFRVQPRM